MPKHLEFRYVFQSAAVKENTVNVFGETGTLFEKGTDYDELITLYVPKLQLSNLILYYNGIVPDGQVGAQDPGSLRSVNAPVDITTISTWRMRNLDPAAPQTNDNGYYYLGDVILFQKDGAGSKSCWTCVRTTSSITDPILARGSFDPNNYFWPKGRIQYTDGTINTATSGGVPGGYYGFNRINQPYIANVPPQTIDFVNTSSASKFKTVDHYDYWQESRIATAYTPDGVYYTDNLVIYNDTVFKVFDTNGSKTIPPLYQKPPEIEGVTYGPASLVDAPNGAFGYDWQGTRYIEGIKPLGDEFSQQFWVITTLPRVPTSTYTFLNWDNVKVREKIQFYDNNILGFKNNQTLNTFTDDSGTDIYTLTSIYNANSKGFSLARADKILASIPAAAIKSQLAGNGLAVDFTLDQMVHSGPVKTTPFNYTPTVQGIFEDALAEDMMRSSGPLTSISTIRVTSQSMGFLSSPSVTISQDTLATNPTSLPTPALAVAKLGIGIMIPTVAGSGYSVGDKLMLNNNLTNEILDTPADVYVYGINADGGVLSVSIVNPGDGYKEPPAVSTSGFYETQTPDGTPGLGTGVVFDLKMTITNISFTAADPFRPIGDGDRFTIDELNSSTLTSGRGKGGKCRAKTPFGMSTVPSDSNFDLVFNTLTDSSVAADLRVSDATNGFGHAVGDVIQLKKDGTTLTTRLAVVDAVNGSGNILAAHILMSGFGYLKAPAITITLPPVDLTASASLADFSSFSNQSSKCFEIADFTQRGRYSMVPLVKGSLANAALYLGIGNVRVLRAGNRFAVGDLLTVGQGGLIPARIKYTSTGLLVYEGGSGYYKDQKIFLSKGDGTTISQNLYNVDEIGGAILSMTIGTPSVPFGENFAVGNSIIVDQVKDLRGIVTEVGSSGQLKPNIDVAFVRSSLTTNSTDVLYAIGDTVNLFADYPILSYVSVDNPGSGFQTPPVITYSWKTSTNQVTQPTNFDLPTVTCILGVLRFNITNGGAGYKVGDALTISAPTGTNSTPAIAEVGVIDPETGAIRAISILTSGSGYMVPPTATISVGSRIGVQAATLSCVLKVVNVQVTNSGNNVYSSSLETTIALNGGTNLAVSTTTIVTGSGGQATVKRAFGTNAPVNMTTFKISDYLTIDFLGDSYRTGNTLKIIKTNVTSATFNSNTKYPEIKISSNGTFRANITAIDVTEGFSGYGYVYGKVEESNAVKANTVTRITVPGFESAPDIRYPKFMPIATGASNAISKLSRYTGDYALDNDEFIFHKVPGTARVAAVDSLGGVTQVSFTSGYGYTSIPEITIPDGSTGSGAIFKIDYLAASRLETSQKKAGTGIGSLLKIETSTEYAEPKAFAAMCGDLFPADLNTARNPNILEQLELAKPGSTTGLASAVPIMGVSAVSVLLRGQGYSPVPTTDVVTSRTYTEYRLVFTEPELKNGKQPVTTLNLNGNGGVNSITINDQGNGYLKIPSAELQRFVVKYKPNLIDVETMVLAADQTGSGSGFLIDTIFMNILSAKILSGGAGYSDAVDPLISFTPDSMNNRPQAFPRMKRAMLGININDRGAYYTTAPNARVQGDGGGVSPPELNMCVADVRIVDGKCENPISKFNRLVIDCYVPNVDIEYARHMRGTNVIAADGYHSARFNAYFRGTTNRTSSDASIKNNYVEKVKLTDLYIGRTNPDPVVQANDYLSIGWFDDNVLANITETFTTVTQDATATNPLANRTLTELAASIQTRFAGKKVTTLVPITVKHKVFTTGVTTTWQFSLGAVYQNVLTSAVISTYDGAPIGGGVAAMNSVQGLGTLSHKDEVTVTLRPLYVTSSQNSTNVITVPQDRYEWTVAKSKDHVKDVQEYSTQPSLPHVYVAAVSSTTDSVGNPSYLVTSVAFGIVESKVAGGGETIYSIDEKKIGLTNTGGDRYLKNPAVVGIIPHIPDEDAIPDPPSFSTRLGIVAMGASDTKRGSGFKSDPAIIIDNPPETQQARYNAGIKDGSVTAIVSTAYGSGYVTVPKVQFAGGGGGGAAANAKLGVTVVSIQNGGRGYLVGDQLLWKKNPTETTLDTLIQPPVAAVSGLDAGGATLGDGLAIDIPSVTTAISWNGTTVTGGTFTHTIPLSNKINGYRDIQQFTDTNEEGIQAGAYSTLCMNVGNQIDGGAALYNYRVNDTLFLKEREFLKVLDYTTKLQNAFTVLTTTTALQKPTLTVGTIAPNLGKLTKVALSDEFFRQPANVSFMQKAPFFCVGDYVLITGAGSQTAILRLNANAKSYDYGSFLTPNNLTFRLPAYNEYQVSRGASFISNLSPDNTNYDTVFEVVYSSDGWLTTTQISSAKLIIQSSNTTLATDNTVVHRVACPTYKVTRVYYSGLRSSVADSPGLPVYVSQLTAGVATRYLKMNTGFSVGTDGIPTTTVLSEDALRAQFVENAAKDDFGRQYPNMSVDSFRLPYMEFRCANRGEITSITILDFGSGYTRPPTCTVDGTNGSGAIVSPLLGVTSLTLISSGSNYTSQPIVYIDAPLHLSAPPEYIANSGAIKTFSIVGNGGRYYRQTDKFLTLPLPGGGTTFSKNTFTPPGLSVTPNTPNGSALYDTNEYILNPIIDGTLHGLNFPDAVTAKVQIRVHTGEQRVGPEPRGPPFTDGFVGAVTDVILVHGGSNYRVGDILEIIDNTKDGIGRGATIRVDEVTDVIGIYPAIYNASKTEIVGGSVFFSPKNFGTGYTMPPKARVVGGAQGITLSATLSLSAIDLFNLQSGGTEYTVGDRVYASSPELGGSVLVGTVAGTRPSAGKTGIITSILMYTPFMKLLSIPSISVQRGTTPTADAIDAILVPAMGVENVQITLSPDGFVGGSLIAIDAPTGISNGNIPATPAQLSAKIFKDVTEIIITQPASPLKYNTVPIISIDAPKGWDPTSFVGWYAMSFDKGDALDTIVQYTIGKALSFQVDPDASLPGKYFTAESIMIGGVNIPLRAAGSRGAQGREMSANKIIHRYLVRYLAI